MRYLPYRIGAWSWIATGGIHATADIVSRFVAADTAAEQVMRGERFAIAGGSNDLYTLNMGFSIAMGYSMLLAGVLFLLAARLADPIERARPIAFVGLAFSLGAFALAVTVIKLPPPIVTFAVACLAFGAAVLSPGRQPSGGNRHVMATGSA
ncbi:LIC_13387 family protein [Nocardia otitidiscaviarum]|uniref:LIC_13387 family protein n=1 Tax=Nocardia otitidiscaviarum TaxID=1823 RepID=UPI001893B66E|nr:hypothetical protein [Nocardia otitidiscaviarum]MBF6240975.1 hypothetical protein [Nocardia otitidiscaviarum]